MTDLPVKGQRPLVVPGCLIMFAPPVAHLAEPGQRVGDHGPNIGDQYSNSAASAQSRHTARAGAARTVKEQGSPIGSRVQGTVSAPAGQALWATCRWITKRQRPRKKILTSEVGPMCAESSVTDLVTRARNADKQAWDALVERYAPLVWSICQRHRLTDAEAIDVGRTVWLQMAGQLDHLPAPTALPGWLATTAVRECRRALRTARRLPGAGHLPDAETFPDERAGVAERELVVAERHAALREAFARLPPRCQQLILLSTEDPPMTPAQISVRLGIPADRVGPTRSRCLAKLRRQSAGAHHAGCAGAPSMCQAPAMNTPAHS